MLHPLIITPAKAIQVVVTKEILYLRKLALWLVKQAVYINESPEVRWTLQRLTPRAPHWSGKIKWDYVFKLNSLKFGTMGEKEKISIIHNSTIWKTTVTILFYGLLFFSWVVVFMLFFFFCKTKIILLFYKPVFFF